MDRKIYIDTIPEFHKVAGLSHPPHALLSVVRLEDVKWKPSGVKTTIVRDFYIIALKKDTNTPIRYGQQDLKIKSDALHFMAPKQVLTIDTPIDTVTNNGLLLLIHRDFLWRTSLAQKIRLYEYFKYEFNPVLALDADEEQTILSVFKQIEKEQYQLDQANTKNIVIAHIELLLAYAERYYQNRELNLSKGQESSVLIQLELQVDGYLRSQDLLLKGVPTIKYLSDKVHVSPNYLSRLVQSLTGQSTQQFLHDKLIALAKEKISTTSLSVSEIAYQLGFTSPKTFSRLFKAKTKQTPTEFRKKF